MFIYHPVYDNVNVIYSMWYAELQVGIGRLMVLCVLDEVDLRSGWFFATAGSLLRSGWGLKARTVCELLQERWQGDRLVLYHHWLLGCCFYTVSWPHNILCPTLRKGKKADLDLKKKGNHNFSRHWFLAMAVHSKNELKGAASTAFVISSPVFKMRYSLRTLWQLSTAVPS